MDLENMTWLYTLCSDVEFLLEREGKGEEWIKDALTTIRSAMEILSMEIEKENLKKADDYEVPYSEFDTCAADMSFNTEALEDLKDIRDDISRLIDRLEEVEDE